MASAATSSVSCTDEEALHTAVSLQNNKSQHPVGLAALGRYVGTFLLVAVLTATAGVASSRCGYLHASLVRPQITTEGDIRAPRPFGPSGLVVSTDTDKNWPRQRKTQSTTSRGVVSLSQYTFGNDEDVVVNFINADDRQPGDWIGITAAGAGDDGLIHDGEYIAYAYVCDVRAEPSSCPALGTVVWSAGLIGPGSWSAYLLEDNNPAPYKVKAGAPTPFTVRSGGSQQYEDIEVRTQQTPAPIPPPPTLRPTASPTASPTSNPTQAPTESAPKSLDTLWDAGIRNSGVMFEVFAKRDVNITGIDVHTPYTDQFRFSVYESRGGMSGKEEFSNLWIKIKQGTVTGAGHMNPTPIKGLSSFILAGRKKAFYIDTPDDAPRIRYSPVKLGTGLVYKENADIQLLVGTGNAPNFGEYYTERMWNGRIHYELV